MNIEVCIQPLVPDACERCDKADELIPGAYVGVPATKIVSLDLRASGHELTVGVYCDKHAEEVTAHLRAALSKEND